MNQMVILEFNRQLLQKMKKTRDSERKKKKTNANIYKGKIYTSFTEMESCFVNIVIEKNAFLYMKFERIQRNIDGDNNSRDLLEYIY